jgi:pimeloyl-ACP methyl ester carboxylesterase
MIFFDTPWSHAMTQQVLVLLPGLLNDEQLWQDQSSALSDIIDPTVPDLTGEDTISGLADSVLAEVPAKRFALAGLSMGGYVALEVMRKAPERVSGLALLDTSARPDTEEAIENRRALMRRAKSDFPSVIEKLLPKMLHPAHLEDGMIAGTFVAMAERLGEEVFVRQQKAIIGRIDSRPSLTRIKCPTLVLCGREDAITPVEVHREIAAWVPTARLEIVKGAGHLSPLEQPEKVTGALRSWIGEIGRA